MKTFFCIIEGGKPDIENCIFLVTLFIYGQAPEYKSYRVKNDRNKSKGPEPEAETDFKGQCSDLEG